MTDQIDHILDNPKFLADLDAAQPIKPTAHRNCQCGPLPWLMGFVMGLFILFAGICIGTYL